MITILFRCDAGERHGLGHLHRCLVVAESFAKHSVHSHFIINAPSEILSRIQVLGFQYTRANFSIGCDDPLDWMAVAPALIVLDGKDINLDYVLTCRTLAPVLYFDDEIPRDIECDLLVNNHQWAKRDQYPTHVARRLMLGAKFNTVHPSFFSIDRERHGLLITLGGEDPGNHTIMLIQALSAVIRGMPVYVVVGPAHPNPESVRAACDKYLPSAEIEVSPASLATFARNCHIAITAAGTTCYELAASGVGMAILVVEEHQERLSQEIISIGAGISLGRYDNIKEEKIISTYLNLTQPSTYTKLAEAGRSYLSSPGADNIVREVLSFLNLQDDEA